MKTAAFSEVRSRLKEMVDQASKGEVVQITRNGKIVAELRPPLGNDSGYWKKFKPLKLGKPGLGSLLANERERHRW